MIFSRLSIQEHDQVFCPYWVKKTKAYQVLVKKDFVLFIQETIARKEKDIYIVIEGKGTDAQPSVGAGI